VDFSTLRRNPNTILSALKTSGDNALVTVRPLRIYLPAFYAERGLADRIEIQKDLIKLRKKQKIEYASFRKTTFGFACENID
jgi:hypothetical protein